MEQLNLYREIISGNTFINEQVSGIFKHSGATETPTDYEIITGDTSELIVAWDLYGEHTDLMYGEIREQINYLYEGTDFASLSIDAKKSVSKWFLVDYDDRITVHTDEEQRENAEILNDRINHTKEENSILKIKNGDNHASVEVSSNLINYKELAISFEADVNGAWHQIELPSEVLPNSVIMINVICTKKHKHGGVREVNSKLDRRKEINARSSVTFVVKTDIHNKIEVYRQTKDVTFFINAQIS